jgi:hypothetical protein
MALRTNGFGVAADSEWQVRIIGTAPGRPSASASGRVNPGIGSRSAPVQDRVLGQVNDRHQNRRRVSL